MNWCLIAFTGQYSCYDWKVKFFGVNIVHILLNNINIHCTIVPTVHEDRLLNILSQWIQQGTVDHEDFVSCGY